MTDASNLVTEEDYSHYTVYELKDELKERGLKVSGKKSDLISRLVSDLNSTVEAVENVIEQTEEAADAVETAVAWQMAIKTVNSPSLLALSRQNLPTLISEISTLSLIRKGGYLLKQAKFYYHESI